MRENQTSEKSPLRLKFEAHLTSWHMNKAEECRRLINKLMLWGAATGEEQTLWKVLEWQIRYLASRKRNSSPEKVVDELFEAPTADEWMRRLQIP
jgi:hypothetical protein